MRRSPPVRGFKIWFFWPLASALLALVVLLGRLQTTEPAKSQVGSITPQGALSSSEPTDDFLSEGLDSSLDDLAVTLLTDSILSIVQSYYVDPGRVDNRAILKTAWEALASSPRITTGFADEEAWIEVDGVRSRFKLSVRPGYEEMLDILISAARLLDGRRITLPLGDQEGEKASLAAGRSKGGAIVLLNSLLASLDAHSALLSPESYRELRQGTEGSFGGLGVLVGIRDDILTVIKPLPRSPASRMGIKSRDRILGIDGVSTYGETLDSLVEHMRGDPGTTVNLSLLRDGANSPAQLNMEREIIHVDSVTWQLVEDDDAKILHLSIENFASRTSKEVLNAIKQSRKLGGGVLHGMILDLRSNPGGLLDQAVQVADLFLQDGVIVTTKGRRQETESAGNGFDQIDFPVAILIDSESASASEIVAGALQDHGRAVVIGQPSFGKGSVQTIFELPGERALKLTIARYYTPHGRSIQNVGIIPDIWMQPVFDSRENRNLLGYYRYKNERFLRHSLTRFDKPQTEKFSLREPVQRAFYMVKNAEQQDPETRPDYELELGVLVLDKLRRTYGDRIPEGSRRASHWLALAGPSVRQRLSKMNRHTSSWLAETHGLDWSGDGTFIRPGAQRRLQVEVHPLNKGPIHPGTEIALAWRIVNDEDQQVDRVSMFLRSEMSGFETLEMLVGQVPSRGERRGTMSFEVPPWMEPGMLTLRFGLAVEAWPLPETTTPVAIDVTRRKVAQLSGEVVLVAEFGGEVEGKLEGAERAQVRVRIANDGEAPARRIRVGLANLSGSQVDVTTKIVEIDRIGVGDAKEIQLDIKGSKQIYSDVIGLGLHMTSRDLRLPFRRRVEIQAVPNAERRAVSNLLGH